MALGSGVGVQGAFELAKTQIVLESLPDSDQPILLTRKGVDARDVKPISNGVGDATEDRVPEVSTPAARPSSGIVQVGDQRWSWTGLIGGGVDTMIDAVDLALRRTGAMDVKRINRLQLRAKKGQVPLAFAATEEISVVFRETPNGWEMSITSRSTALRVSDFGRNEAHIRELLAALGIAER